MKSIVKQMYSLIEKDIISQLRTKEMISAMFIFILLVFVILNFGFFDVLQVIKADKKVAGSIGGLLWVALTFAAVLGLNRTFVSEKDEGVMDGLLLAPFDRSLIYWSKFFSNIIFLGVVQIISLPIFVLFFVSEGFLAELGLLILTIVLGDLGIVAVGTLLSAISVNTKARDLMLPILFFPVIIPLLIGVVKLSGFVFALNADPQKVSLWLQFLILYDIIFLIVPFLVFDFIVED
ncbi:MAG: cytochrome C biogenesis protein [Actinobacteria bacterium]|nr:MAG: cytochrome C biogenesis protein [Actinomycetota bacterium]